MAEGKDGGWPERLQAALEALRARLEERDLPRLQQALGLFRSTYDNVHQLLLRKSMISEDRYRYDAQPKKLAAPPDDAMPDTERGELAALRLAAYHAQLELLAGELQPSLESLTLETLRPVADLVRYIRWGRLLEGSESPITRCMAEYLSRIRRGNDSLSSKVLLTSVDQLERLSRELTEILERVTAYQREAYKGRLRSEVLPDLDPAGGEQERIERARRHFAAAQRGRPFYPELLREVIAEDAPSGEGARSRALARLGAGGREAAPPGVKDRASLLAALRTLSLAARPLAECAAKVAANDQIRRGDGAPKGLKGLLKRLLRKPPEAASYRVEYLDGAVMRSETLVLTPFLEELGRQTRVLAALSRADGTTAARVAKASDQSLLDFIDRQFAALEITHRRLAGLSELFRKQGPDSGGIKGIKIELTLLKNALIRANQQRHEYTGARERREQARQLGLEV